MQADAAALLGWESLTVIKGGGGEFECNPAKAIAGFGLRGGAPWESILPARTSETRRLAGDGTLTLGALRSGRIAPDFETEIVMGTCELALDTLDRADARSIAAALWSARDPRHAA